MTSANSITRSSENKGYFQRTFSIDMRTLALFRVLLGINALWTFITLALYVKPFYSNEGVLPASMYVYYAYPYQTTSIFLANDTITFALVLFVLGALSSVAVIFGWKTRWASIWMSFFLVALHLRNPQAIVGPDTVLRYLAFWALFLPLGDKYAWDAPGKVKKRSECSFATMALMMQAFIIYIFAFYFKMVCYEWLDGTAMQCALNYGYTSTRFGQFLLNFPGLLHFTTYGVLLVEIACPFMLISPSRLDLMRTWALLLLAALQLGIFLAIDVINFPPVATLATVPFIPASWWDWAARFGPVKRAGKLLQRLLSRPKILGPAPAHGLWEMPFRRLLAGFALYFSIFMFYTAVVSTNLGFVMPSFLHAPMRGFMLNEMWAAFSKEGHFPNINFWYVPVGKLKDGREWNILIDKPVEWERPIPFAEGHRTSRWGLYIRVALNTYALGGDYRRYYFLKYILAEWNARHSGDSEALKVDFYEVTQKVRPLGPLNKRIIATYPSDVKKLDGRTRSRQKDEHNQSDPR